MKFYSFDFSLKRNYGNNCDYKYIIYQGEIIGHVIFNDVFDVSMRDKCYEALRKDGLNVFDLNFVSHKCFFENYRLYQKGERCHEV